MKKILILTFILSIFLTVPAFSKDSKRWHIEGAFNFALETDDDIGLGMGGSLGIGYDLTKLMGRTLQIRADVSMNYWSSDLDGNMASGHKFKLMRIPLDLGARWLFKLNDWWTIYPELGAEISFDIQNTISRASHPYVETEGMSRSKIRFGGFAGFGTYFRVWKELRLGINAKYHIIQGDYFTFSPTVGYKF